MLDSEEYFHLAINASQNNQHHAALEYLHQCLELSPDHAQAMFLLSAEYAELGLYGRAITGMEKCLELDPGLEMAYYQLGLLYLQQGDPASSSKLWQHLSDNSKDLALLYFAQGMLLLETDHARGMDLIRQATEQETSNQAFQTSMINIMTRLLSAPENEAASAQQESEPMHPMFLNAYKHSSFEPDDN